MLGEAASGLAQVRPTSYPSVLITAVAPYKASGGNDTKFCAGVPQSGRSTDDGSTGSELQILMQHFQNFLSVNQVSLFNKTDIC